MLTFTQLFFFIFQQLHLTNALRELLFVKNHLLFELLVDVKKRHVVFDVNYDVLLKLQLYLLSFTCHFCSEKDLFMRNFTKLTFIWSWKHSLRILVCSFASFSLFSPTIVRKNSLKCVPSWIVNASSLPWPNIRIHVSESSGKYSFVTWLTSARIFFWNFSIVDWFICFSMFFSIISERSKLRSQANQWIIADNLNSMNATAVKTSKHATYCFVTIRLPHGLPKLSRDK